MSGGGNPYHDDLGQFSSGAGSGGKKGPANPEAAASKAWSSAKGLMNQISKIEDQWVAAKLAGDHLKAEQLNAQVKQLQSKLKGHIATVRRLARTGVKMPADYFDDSGQS